MNSEVELRESGIPWIGLIPVSWEIQKLKYHVERHEPRNPGNMEVLSLYREFGIVPKNSRDDNHNVTSLDTSSYEYVVPGNFVVNKMKAWQGSVAVSDYRGIVSPAYYVYRFTNDMLVPKYLHYLLRSCYRDEFRRLSHGIREGQWDLSSDELENVSILIPSKQEQEEIVHYVEAKAKEIDELIGLKQTQLSTLESYKQSVIFEAVTKGLNPAVEMGDSGIQWVSIIPRHWQKHPLYYYFNEVKNKNSRSLESNLLSLSYGKIIRKNINNLEGLVPDNFSAYNIVDSGDIVLRLTDLQNDQHSLRTGLMTERGIITSAYVTLRPNALFESSYAKYLLHAYDVAKVLYGMGSGVRQSLNYSELSKLPIIEPPLEEQKAISEFLDKKVTEIDELIELKKKQLDTLAEYRKSLIYEVVTGKREVPEL